MVVVVVPLLDVGAVVDGPDIVTGTPDPPEKVVVVFPPTVTVR
jgi:hypothetical protein